MREFTVEIKALTPIWTGDVEGKNSRLRETGIIGSLRWWYEAVVRGLEGYACDPTDTKCEFNYKAYKKTGNINDGFVWKDNPEKNVCDACKLFGCTGWSRRFQLCIDTLKESYAPFVIVKPVGSKRPFFLGYYDNTGNEYQQNGGFLGDYKLKLLSNKENIELIKLFTKLSIHWGLGAGVQKGFGITYPEDKIQLSDKFVKNLSNTEVYDNQNALLPRTNQFFFYKIPVDNKCVGAIRNKINGHLYKTMGDCKNNRTLTFDFSNLPYIPSAPIIRKSIRRLFNDDVLRHYLMGFVSVNGNPKPMHIDCWKHAITNDKYNNNRYYCRSCKKGNIEKKEVLVKTGSKIFISHIYDKNRFKKGENENWEMKIWGWIPELPDASSKKRNRVKKLLQQNIKSESFWKNSFNSDNSYVQIDEIWEKWDENIKDLVKGGDIFE